MEKQLLIVHETQAPDAPIGAFGQYCKARLSDFVTVVSDRWMLAAFGRSTKLAMDYDRVRSIGSDASGHLKSVSGAL